MNYELRDKRLNELKYLMTEVSNKNLDIIELKLFIKHTLFVDHIDLTKYVKSPKMESA